MRFAQEHLIFKALLALQEAVNQSRQGPVRPSFALRFAAAYLHAVSKVDDPQTFAEFWHTIQDGLAQTHNVTQANTIRATFAQSCLDRIARSVGYPLVGENRHQIFLAGLPKAKRMALAARDEQARAARAKAGMSQDALNHTTRPTLTGDAGEGR